MQTPISDGSCILFWLMLLWVQRDYLSKCWSKLLSCLRDGIQQWNNCWQDGFLSTNCPIVPWWNWIYNFQIQFSTRWEGARGAWIPLSLHMLYYSMGMGLMLDWKVGSTSSQSWTLQVHETKIRMLGLYSLSFFGLWMVKSVLIVKYLLSYCSQMYDFLVYSHHPVLFALLLHLLGHTNSRCNFSLPFFAKLIMIIMIYWLVFRIHFYF
jgi:hypothetical protein